MNRFSGMLQAFAGMLVLLALDQFSKIWVRETIPLYAVSYTHLRAHETV